MWCFLSVEMVCEFAWSECVHLEGRKELLPLSLATFFVGREGERDLSFIDGPSFILWELIVWATLYTSWQMTLWYPLVPLPSGVTDGCGCAWLYLGI